jgi:CRP/FNR family transcriptional regulator, cyclic AMP receptor protein
MNSSTGPSPKPEASCAYSSNLDTLRELPLFSGVPLEACKVLAYLCQGETYQPGDYLIRQDEHADSFRHVLCGRLSVSRGQNGGDILVKELAPGDSFGGLGLVLGGKSLFDVKALEETTTMTLTRDKYLKTAQRFPQIEPALLAALAGHVLAWEERFLLRHPEQFAQLSGDFGISLY